MMILEGNFYKTRDGRKAQIYKILEQDEYPVHGSILVDDDDDEWIPESWSFEGQYVEDKPCDNWDLVSEWREPIKLEGWINVYPKGVFFHDDVRSVIHKTKESADKYAETSRITCVKVVCQETP